MASRRSNRWRACSVVGCAELVNNDSPCPVHGRKKSDPWGKDRTPEMRAAQARARRAALKRDQFTCTRCGHHDPTGKTLQLHHLRTADDNALEHVTILCNRQANGCHSAVDHWAR